MTSTQENTTANFTSWLRKKKPDQKETEILSYIKWYETYFNNQEQIIGKISIHELRSLIDSLSRNVVLRFKHGLMLKQAIRSLKLYYEFIVEKRNLTNIETDNTLQQPSHDVNSIGLRNDNDELIVAAQAVTDSASVSVSLGIDVDIIEKNIYKNNEPSESATVDKAIINKKIPIKPDEDKVQQINDEITNGIGLVILP